MMCCNVTLIQIGKAVGEMLSQTFQILQLPGVVVSRVDVSYNAPARPEISWAHTGQAARATTMANATPPFLPLQDSVSVPPRCCGFFKYFSLTLCCLFYGLHRIMIKMSIPVL